MSHDSAGRITLRLMIAATLVAGATTFATLSGAGVANAAIPTVNPSSILDFAYNGYCFDAEGGDYGPGDPLQLWQCNGNDEQIWFLEGDQIMNFDGTDCLSASSTDFPMNGNEIELEPCDSHAVEQQWTYEGADGNIKSVFNNNFCLDAKSQEYPPNDDNPDPLQVWTCADNERQNWGLTDAYCPDVYNQPQADGGEYHEYSHQYVDEPSMNWDGETGNFVAPNFLDTFPDNLGQDDASLSHLYMEEYYGSPDEIEVGFIEGEGPDGGVNNRASYFYYTYQIDNAYNETNGDTVTPGDTYSFGVYYNGIDLRNGLGKWSVDENGGVTNLEISLYGGLQPTAGSEDISKTGDDVPVATSGTPSFALEDTSGNWSDWTTSIPTATCSDPGITFSESSKYERYSATGEIGAGH